MIPAMVQRLRFSINVQRSFTEIYPNFSEGCVIMAEKRRCTIAGIIILFALFSTSTQQKNYTQAVSGMSDKYQLWWRGKEDNF